MSSARKVVRLLGGVLVAGTCAIAAPRAAADDLKVGARVGFYTEVSKPFVGGELLVRVAHRLYFNPNLEVVFVDDGSYLTFNGDFHYDFPTKRPLYLWLGGGLGVVSVNPDGPDNSDTHLAANFLGGIGFRAGSTIPYFQAKVIAMSDSEFSLAFGIRF
jgi:hypothetical protein